MMKKFFGSTKRRFCLTHVGAQGLEPLQRNLQQTDFWGKG
jgi:hypothetical protein